MYMFLDAGNYWSDANLEQWSSLEQLMWQESAPAVASGEARRPLTRRYFQEEFGRAMGYGSSGKWTEAK
jgi:hypothetical protein